VTFGTRSLGHADDGDADRERTGPRSSPDFVHAGDHPMS
jgi:hypothetical protein